ncbi:hypothetical protein D3C76_792790 [compost metagenome]
MHICTCGQRRRASAIRAGGQFSPPVYHHFILLRDKWARSSASIIVLNIDGNTNVWVTFHLSIHSANRSAVHPRLGKIATVPPIKNVGIELSFIAAVLYIGAFKSITAELSSPRNCVTCCIAPQTTAEDRITTPLGLPVVPEVYRIIWFSVGIGTSMGADSRARRSYSCPDSIVPSVTIFGSKLRK